MEKGISHEDWMKNVKEINQSLNKVSLHDLIERQAESRRKEMEQEKNKEK